MLRNLTALIVVCALAAGLAQAQNNLSIRGFVVDPTGASVPNAPIQLLTRSGARLLETHSDATGDFTFTGVSRGDFLLSLPAFSGFAAQTQPVHVAAGVTGLKLSLAIASVTQDLVVDGNQALSTESSANTDTVAVKGDELRKLPVLDMDYVAALSSFLDASSTGSGGATLIVDGVEMKSAGVSPSAIQEVRINNDPYSAEFTRPGRGRIEIITKPGSQQFHGEADFLFRDAVFNAKNHFAVTRPAEVRRFFDGHLTGPVGHARHTSFIASGVYGQRNSDVAAVNAIGPNGPINQNVRVPQRQSQASLRINHDFSERHRLQAGYNFEYYTAADSGAGGLVLPEAGVNQQSREDDAIFNDRIIVTPNLINQLLVTFEKDEDVTASVTAAQSIQVVGAFTGGGAQNDVNRTENTLHINEVMSWSHGRHYLRLGAQLPQLSRRAVDDRSNRLGTFTFASLADYVANRPYVFTAQQGPGRGLYWINEIGAFIQDQIKLSPHLQLSLGLRYDWQTYLSDNNNLAPRVSLSYAPGKGKTILRLGSGIFYDRTGGDFPAVFKLHNGIALRTVQIQNPAYPLVSGAVSSSSPSNLVQEASNLRAPYTVQSSIGIERQLGGLTLTASYRNSVQAKSFRSRDANAPMLPPNPSLGATYPRPNPAYGQIQQIESGGRQMLNAFDLGLREQAGRWFSGQAQYTLSRVRNNTGGIARFPQNQYLPNAEWGRADFDRLHSLNVLGNINPDHWLTLGISLMLGSGLPYTETTGTDDFHTGLGNARPAGVGRNSLQGAANQRLDLSWTHDFRLTKATGENARVFTAGLSAVNVLNHANYVTYIGALSSPRFRQPIDALNGRQMQLTLGFRF